MGDLEIYPFVIPWTLLAVGLIAMRIIGFVHGNRLPLFYFASRQSTRLSPDRLRRYRALRSTGLSIGLLTVTIGYVITLAIDAALGVTTLFYCIGLSMMLSSAFYLEYCMATGRISPPASE